MRLCPKLEFRHWCLILDTSVRVLIWTLVSHFWLWTLMCDFLLWTLLLDYWVWILVSNFWRKTLMSDFLFETLVSDFFISDASIQIWGFRTPDSDFWLGHQCPNGTFEHRCPVLILTLVSNFGVWILVSNFFYVISSVMHAFWLVLTDDLLEDRRIDDVIIKTFFNSLLYKTNRFQVAVRLFSNRSQRTSKYGKNISDTFGCASCATFLFLPHFDVICDLLLNRRTAIWNPFVK